MTTLPFKASAYSNQKKWHVDFSSAMENKTGKYFIGRDIIETNRGVISHVHYWRHRTDLSETPVFSSFMSVGSKIELRALSVLGFNIFPTIGSNERCLHLDPHSVLHAGLRPQDIVLCHDLGPISHPNLFNSWVSKLYKHAYEKIYSVKPQIVFVSQSSKDEFFRLYGHVLRTSVIYPPIRKEMDSVEADAVDAVKRPFILTVGSLGRRKNQAAMIQAYAQSRLNDKGISYVLCGARETGYEEVEQIARNTPGVQILDYVSNAHLNWLYAQARIFLLASRLEGFGVPVAEAIKNGLMPVVTRGSVLYEVAGPDAIDVDCDSIESISQGIEQAMDMDPLEKAGRISNMQLSLDRFSQPSFRHAWTEILRAEV